MNNEPILTVGDYRIIRKLDRQGGMSVVFEARQAGTGRRVALKMLNTALRLPMGLKDPAEPEGRFHREIEIASRLEHPNIARVYDGDAGGEIPYYAMEFIDGLPLDEHVRLRQLGIRGILQLMIQICRAVDFAHRRGVIHRDLKPTNILVADDVPKVLDFGLAKALSEASESDPYTDLTLRSLDGQFLGTPAFMSPEQARGENRNLDIRTDVFSLGAILQLLLTGKLPHEPGPGIEFLHRIGSREAETPERNIRGGRLFPDLRAILRKALAFDRERRYHSAEELARDLECYLRKDPVSASSISPFYLLSKHLRKHWKPYSAATALLTVAAIAGITSILQTRSFARDMQISAETQASLRIKAEESKKIAEDQQKRADEQRDAANDARQVAEVERKAANQAASDASFLLSRRFDEEGDRPRMFAHLAAAVRRDPENRSARAAAVMALLQDRSLVEAYRFRVRAPINVAEFSADGKWLLVAGKGEAEIRSVADGSVAQRVEFHGYGFRGGFLGGQDAALRPPVAVLASRFPQPGGGWNVGLFCFGLDWKQEPMKIPGTCQSIVLDRKAPRFLMNFNRENMEVFYSAWELNSERKLVPLFEEHHAGQGHDRLMMMNRGPAFHPAKDGVLFAQAMGKGRSNLQYFDLNRRIFEPSGMSVNGGNSILTNLVLSQSGELFGACGINGAVSVWRLTGPELISHFNHGGRYGHSVNGVDISKDDRYVSAGIRNGNAVVWDLETKEEVAQLKHDTQVSYTEFGPHARILLTVTVGGRACLWDWKKGEQLVPPFQHGSEDIKMARLSPDGRDLITVSAGEDDEPCHVRVWKTSPREIKPREIDLRHPLTNVEITPDGRWLLTASKQSRIAMVTPVDASQKPVELPHQPCKFRPFNWYAPASDPSGQFFAVGEDENTLAIHRYSAPQAVAFRIRNRHPITIAKFSAEGSLLAIGDRQNQVCVWKIEGDGAREIRRFSLNDRIQFKIDDESLSGTVIINLAFSPDGKYLVAANYGRSIVGCWKMEQTTTAPDHYFDASDAPVALEFSRDSKWLGIGTFHFKAHVISLESPGKKAVLYQGGSVYSVKFVPGQSRIISASGDGTMRIGRYGPGFLTSDVPPFNFDFPLTRVEVGGDGFLAATAGRNQVDLWDLHHTERFAAPFQHPASVREIRFHPTESAVVTACDDGKARFWPISGGAGAAPYWFPDFLESVGGQRLNDANELEPLTAEQGDALLESTISRVRLTDPEGWDDYLEAAARYLGSQSDGKFKPPTIIQPLHLTKSTDSPKGAAEFSKWLENRQFRHPSWVLHIRGDHAEVARNSGIFQSWKIRKIDAATRSIHFSEPWRIFEIDKTYQNFRMSWQNGKRDRDSFPVESLDSKIFDQKENLNVTLAKSQPAGTPGNLVIHGKVYGKPFTVPAELKSASVEWIKPTDKGAYLGTTSQRVVFVDHRGIHPVDQDSIREIVPDGFGPWEGTVLTKGHDLKWTCWGNHRGTLQNVSKFSFGSRDGGKSFASLFALSNTGQLDLINLQIEMDWPFKTWAEGRTFKDIAMSNWQGILAPALAVTTDGELFAFNTEGFFELPDEIKTQVRSVCSTGAGVVLAVVKENGDIYEVARGLETDFPLDLFLSVWQKTPGEKFGAKKPVKVHSGYAWKSVQFEDGSWEAWRGRSGFQSRIFEKEIDAKPYRDLRIEISNAYDTEYFIGVR